MTVFKKIPWLLSLFLLPFSAFAQNCGCDDCGILIPEASLDTFDFEINGLINNDLSDINQGICGVELHFEHFRVRGLEIILISPAGDRVRLVGNNLPTPTITTTPGADWDITFLRSSDVASPDPGIPPFWWNGHSWAAFGQYTGSYYPNGGTLESFSSGSANGTWQLVIQNWNPDLVFTDYVGELIGFRLLFCDPTGITCCFAEAGEIIGPNIEEYCLGDTSLLLDPNLRIDSPPDSNFHTFNWLIGQDTVLLKYDTIADLRTFPPGEYEVCGFSYLNSDADSLWVPDGTLRWDSLKAHIERSDTSFCADISNRCLKVIINAPPAITNLQDTFCVGTNYSIGDSTFFLPGNYDVLFQLTNGCDSLVQLELAEVLPDTTYLTETVCFDSTFRVGTSVYSSSGIYIDVFPGGRYCDSIVKLDLTVLPLLQTTIDTVLCLGDTIQIGNQKYFENGNYSTLIRTSNGCDSTVDLNLRLLNPRADIAPVQMINCNDPTIIINGSNSQPSGRISYNWSTADGIISGGINGSMLVAADSGNYRLIVVQDSLGVSCRDTAMVFVDLNQTAPNVQIEFPDTLTCDRLQVVLDGSNSSQGVDYQYVWRRIGSGIIAGATTDELTVTTPGEYELVVTDTRNGCRDSLRVEVFEDKIDPISEAGIGFELDCQNTSGQLSGNGSSTGNEFSYQWTGGNIVSGSTGLMPTIDQPAKYFLRVENTQTGCFALDSVTVTRDTLTPDADAGNDRTINCRDSVLTLTGNSTSLGANFDYTWTAVTGSIIDRPNAFSIRVRESGTYVFEVLNNQTTCVETDTVIIDIDKNLPNADAGRDTTLDCFVTQIELSGSGTDIGMPFFHQWYLNNFPVFGANQPEITVSEPGNYFLEVLNGDNFCRDTAYVQVAIDTISPTVNPGVGFELNCTVTDSLLNATAGTSAGANFTYQWTGPSIISGAQTLRPRVSREGWYVLEVTNIDNFCTKKDSVEVTIDEDLPTADAGQDDVLNCQNDTLRLIGSGSTGADFRYTWTTPNGNIINQPDDFTIEVDRIGEYVFSVTNITNLCVKTDTVRITEDFNFPNADAGQDSTLNCLVNQIEIGGTGTDAGAEFSYQWLRDNLPLSGETQTKTIITDAGRYGLVITNDNNLCTDTSFVDISIDTIPPIAVAGVGFELNCTVSDSLLDASASTSSGNDFIYNWTGPSIISDEETLRPRVNREGWYLLEVTDTTNFCNAIDSVEVTIDEDLPTADAGQDTTLNCKDSLILLEGITPNLGTDFSYEWSEIDGKMFDPLAPTQINIRLPGRYVFSVTNTTNLCIKTDTVEVFENKIFPIADSGLPDTLTCFQDTITLGGIGTSSGAEYSYQWFRNGTLLSGSTDQSLKVFEGGIYRLEVMNDDNFCDAFDEVAIHDDIVYPRVDAGLPDTLNCTETVLTIGGPLTTIAPPMVYSWTTDIGCFETSFDMPTVEIGCAGQYILQVFNIENGCGFQDTVDIARDADFPTAFAGNPDTLTCVDSLLTLVGTSTIPVGDGSVFWTSSGSGNIRSGERTLTPTINQPGIYELVIERFDNNCTDTSRVVVIEIKDIPNADAGADQELNCRDNFVILDGTDSDMLPIITYQWFDDSGTAFSGETGQTFSVSDTGVYVLELFNNQSECRHTDTVRVTENIEFPNVEAGNSFTLNCTIDTFRLEGFGSTSVGTFDFVWSTDTGQIVGNQDTLNPLVNADGYYFLTVIDTTNFCESKDSVLILSDGNLPSANTVLDTIRRQCDPPFEIILDGTGSSTGVNYIYEWQGTPGANFSDPNGLVTNVDTSGLFILEVTDTTNNCSATVPVFVIDTIFPTILLDDRLELDCNDLEDGIRLDASGSSQGADFDLLWSVIGASFIADENTLTPTINAPGLYGLQITNTTNGCFTEEAVQVILGDGIPKVDAGLNFVIECDSSFAFLGTNFTSDSADIRHTWTTPDGRILSGQGTPFIVTDSSGLYFLEVENLTSACIVTDSVYVSKAPCNPGVNVSVLDTITCLISEVRLDARGSNFLDARLEWNVISGTILADRNTPMPLVSAGTYSLTLTDTTNNLTTTSDLIIVPVDTLHPIAAAGLPQLLTCRDSSVILAGSYSDLDPAFAETTWTGPGQITPFDSLQPTVFSPGLFEILVENRKNGCFDSDTVRVRIDTLPPVAAVVDQTVMFPCGVDSVLINGTGTSNGSDFNFIWSTGSQSLESVIRQPGEYCIFVERRSNGCRDTACVQVIPDQNAPIIAALGTDSLTCKDTLFSLSADVPPGNLQIAWQTSDGCILTDTSLQNIMVNCIGNYELVVTDLDNNCKSAATAEIIFNENNPNADAGLPVELTCRDSVLTLSGNSNNATVDFQYLWAGNAIRNGANSLTPEVDSVGIYYLEVRDTSTGCFSLDSVLVTENYNFPTADAGDDLLLNCNVDTLSLNGLRSAPTGMYEWSILTPGNIISGINSLEPMVDSAGVYLLKITDALTGCASFDTVEVTANFDLPNIILAANQLELNCYSDEIMLDATASLPAGNLNFRWTTLGGNIVTSSVAPNVSVDTSGWYFIVAERQDNGCLAEDSVFVKTNRVLPPVFIAIPDTLTCSVSEVDLEASVPDSIMNFDINWETLSGNFTAAKDPLTTTVDLPERYTARVINIDNGCENEVSIVVSIDTIAPTAEAAVGTVLDCFNTSVLLNGTAGSPSGNLVNFQWTTSGSGNISNPNSAAPTVDEEGTYTFSVTDLGNGCEAKDSIFVSRDAEAIESYVVDIQPVSCYEISDAAILIDSVSGGSPPYIFSLDGEPFVGFGQFSSLEPGDYEIVIQDATGCETDTTIRIETGNELLIDLGLDLTILQGDSTTLEALINVPQSSISELDWRPLEEVSCKGCFVQKVAPMITTEYFVSAVDSNGCRASDKILITVSAERPVYIPGAFSPNGDGDNDIFMVYGRSDLIKIDVFQIYDRWGNLLHEAQNVEPGNPDFGWDGNFRGKRMNENVFVYFAKIEFPDGRVEVFEGDLTLLR